MHALSWVTKRQFGDNIVSKRAQLALATRISPLRSPLLGNGGADQLPRQMPVAFLVLVLVNSARIASGKSQAIIGRNQKSCGVVQADPVVR
jgi:hypothetical protein